MLNRRGFAATVAALGAVSAVPTLPAVVSAQDELKAFLEAYGGTMGFDEAYSITDEAFLVMICVYHNGQFLECYDKVGRESDVAAKKEQMCKKIMKRFKTVG